MAKKSNEKLINSVLPVNDLTWLIQPITITVSKFDYDTTQTKFLVAIVEGLQESIKQSVTKEVTQLPLFSDGLNDNELQMNIPLKNLGVDPRRYTEIKDSLKKLATTPFEMAVKDENGKNYTRYSGLCEVYIPEGKYIREVMVKIKKDVALKLVDARENGYQKYLKQVMMKTKNKYTQRMYLLITSWKVKGEFSLKVSSLRSILQLEDKYLRWSSFNANVIRSAAKELKENYDAGLCECYFEAESVYKNGKEWGEPDLIHFIIHVSQQEKENMFKQSFYSLKMQIDENLRTQFKIKVKIKRERLLRLVTEENITQFMDYLRKLEASIMKQQASITDIGEYAYSSCYRYLKNNIPEAQYVVQSQTSEDVTVEEIYLKEIESYKKNIRKRVGEKDYEIWIQPLRFDQIEKIEKGLKVRFVVPSKFFYDMIEEKFIVDIKTSLKLAFKQDIVSIMYRLNN